MKEIFALSGISGVGKTYRRTTDPALKDLPYIDIADIYRNNPGMPAVIVFYTALHLLQDKLCENDKVVFEAALLPTSRQRPLLESMAHNLGARVRYITIQQPPKAELLRRIEADYAKTKGQPGAEKYYNARKAFIESVA